MSKEMTLMDKLVQVASSPETSKADVMQILKYLCDNDKNFSKYAGTISEEDIEEINKISAVPSIEDKDVDYKKEGNTIEVHKVEKSKKIVSLYVQEASKEEARYFTDLYYQIQAFRIAMENQIRSIDQGYDQADNDHKDDKQRANKKLINTPATMAFRHHILNQVKTIEDDIKGCLSDYSDRMPMGKYAKSIKGIGPVFATILCSYLDIPDKETLPPDKQVYTVGNWISYCGLNDNNRPWIKSDKIATQMVEDAIKENAGIIDEDTVRILCSKSQWNYDHYYKFCCDRKTGKFTGFTKDKLIKGTKIPPYSKDLKKTMYLIGESFIKVQNKEGSLYGKLYKERLQYEIDRNEAGGNKEAAEKALSEKNYGKATLAYKAYVEGKLPKAQLVRRASRHTVKIFLNHLFEFAYQNKYHESAPVPYVFTLDGTHKDYIGPEVPYDNYL